MPPQPRTPGRGSTTAASTGTASIPPYPRSGRGYLRFQQASNPLDVGGSVPLLGTDVALDHGPVGADEQRLGEAEGLVGVRRPLLRIEQDGEGETEAVPAALDLR